MKKIRKHYVFSGRVQGVGFRFTADSLAKTLGLTGWVHNDWDGTVSMEVQGPESDIDKMIHRLRTGSYIRIEHMCELDMPVLEDERRFRIK